METYAKIVPSLGELDWEGLLGQTIMHMKKENWSEMKGTLVKLRYDIVETLSVWIIYPLRNHFIVFNEVTPPFRKI